MKAKIEGLMNLIKTDTIINVENGNKLKTSILGMFKGTVIQKDGNIAYVPQLTCNLLSITKVIKGEFMMRKNNCVIKFDRI